MPAFYPSCVVNFKIKFDETLTVRNAGPLIKQGTTQAGTTTSPGSSEPLVMQADDPSRVVYRIPKAMSLEKPGYRSAGKFDLTMDFRELPIDPRTVRSALVEIYLGAVDGEKFGEGFAEGKNGRDATGRMTGVLVPDQSNLALVGLIDDWSVEHSGSGSEVGMSGRDLRGVLLDTPIGAGVEKGTNQLEKIDWGQRIDMVVANILSLNPFYEAMEVVVNDADWPGGVVPSPGLGESGTINIQRFQKGARGKRKSKKGAGKPNASSGNLNFWDVIVRSCYLCGGIPYMDGAELHIRPSKSVYDKLRGPIDPKTNPTPFKGGVPRGRDAVSGDEINPGLKTRKIVYGRDIESVRVSRKFQGWRKPKVIRTIAVDLNAGKGKGLVQGIWPPDAFPDAQKTDRTPGKEKTKQTILTVPVPGVTDEYSLTVIAASIFEEIGRGEMGGEVSTGNLSSFGGDNLDPDLLTLSPGDGIEFGVDVQAVRSGVQPLVSSYVDINRVPFNQAVEEIGARLGDENLARVIVATARGQVAELQSFFRVQNVKYAWDYSDGVKISFDFQNYVVARYQVEDSSAVPGKAERVAAQKAFVDSTRKDPGSLGNI